jgi:hydroxybutyrate-dimer hydrolase
VIYTNYRAILDITAAGGYGTLYGPNIDNNGNDTLGEGRIAGTETLAYADDGTGKKNVTVMVQIPVTFSKDAACIVAAPSSLARRLRRDRLGRRMGLKRGCAVAYTDAGKGIGYQDLAADKVNLIQASWCARVGGGSLVHFPDLTGAALAAFNTRPQPRRVKHVHSQQNPEKDWGKNTLTRSASRSGR